MADFKIVRIFIASSITELSEDRLRISDFIRKLDDIYFDRGLRFKLEICEDVESSIVPAGKQAQYDKLLAESDLCFVLVFKKLGDYTKHEFEVALDNYLRKDRPKITVYFKYVDKAEDVSESVVKFAELLDSELKHFYNTYSHIDTLLLGILMQVKLLKLDCVSVELKDGGAYGNGTQLISLENVPMYYNATGIREVKERLAELTEKLPVLRAKAKDDPDDTDAYRVYFAASGEINALNEQLKQAEEHAAALIEYMYEETPKGKLTRRQIEGYRLLELGKYAEALEALDRDAINADIRRFERLHAASTEGLQINVNELLQRIEILKTGRMDGKKAEEILNTYADVFEMIKKYALDTKPVYDYAWFSYLQKDYKRSMQTAEWLRNQLCESTPEREKARLYNLLGSLYQDNNRMAEAETAYLSSLEMYKRLAAENPAEYVADVADSYNSLGIYYRQNNCMAEAETAYLSSLEIYKRLVLENPTAYEADLAGSYNNLGNYYSDNNRMAEAETAYLSSLETYKRLAAENPAAYESALAMIQYNLGLYYRDNGRLKPAREAFLAAYEIYKPLADAYPDAYGKKLYSVLYYLDKIPE